MGGSPTAVWERYLGWATACWRGRAAGVLGELRDPGRDAAAEGRGRDQADGSVRSDSPDDRLTGPDASEDTRQYVAEKRAAIELALRDRFDRAIEAGELPVTVSAPDLARFYSVVIQGIALQAQHGGTQEQLFGVVDMAMESWPVRSRKRR